MNLYTVAQVDELVELYFALGYDQGRLDESRRIGEAVADLEETWVAQGYRTHEQRVAARIRDMYPIRDDWLDTSAARLRSRDRDVIHNQIQHPIADEPVPGCDLCARRLARRPVPYSGGNGTEMDYQERALFGSLGVAA
jgi:hypothetical protein